MRKELVCWKAAIKIRGPARKIQNIHLREGLLSGIEVDRDPPSPLNEKISNYIQYGKIHCWCSSGCFIGGDRYGRPYED